MCVSSSVHRGQCVGSSAARVIVACEPLHMKAGNWTEFWEMNLGSLQEQFMLLTVDSSLLHLTKSNSKS